MHVTEILQGGITTYLNEILPWQAEKYGKSNVALVCPEEHVQSLNTDARNAATNFTYSRKGRNVASLARLGLRFRQVQRDWIPSLVHAHSSFAGFVCRSPGILPKIPLVYCAHGWVFAREDSAILRRTYGWAEIILQHKAEAIIAITHHDKRLAVKAGLAGERIKVIRLGIRDITSKARTEIRVYHKPMKLLFVGRFDQQKGLDWLLDVMKELSPEDVQLDVVGATILSGHDYSSFSAPNVRFHGWASPAQVDEHMGRCDAVIMPSRWEGCGLVALEAMRKGVPVLVSNRGALPEVIGGDEAGWVFGLENPQSLKELLGGLRPKELFERGQGGRTRYIEHYQAQRMNKETAALYEHVISHRVP